MCTWGRAAERWISWRLRSYTEDATPGASNKIVRRTSFASKRLGSLLIMRKADSSTQIDENLSFHRKAILCPFHWKCLWRAPEKLFRRFQSKRLESLWFGCSQLFRLLWSLHNESVKCQMQPRTVSLQQLNALFWLMVRQSCPLRPLWIPVSGIKAMCLTIKSMASLTSLSLAWHQRYKFIFRHLFAFKQVERHLSSWTEQQSSKHLEIGRDVFCSVALSKKC